MVGSIRGAELQAAYESLLDAVWKAEADWKFADRIGGLPIRRLISGEVYAARRGTSWSWENR